MTTRVTLFEFFQQNSEPPTPRLRLLITPALRSSKPLPRLLKTSNVLSVRTCVNDSALHGDVLPKQAYPPEAALDIQAT